MTDVLAVNKWRTNAHLIADVARLGYIRKEWLVLDPTYGMGTFWRRWRPDHLTGSDIDVRLSPCGVSVDFTCIPASDGYYDAVVFDPPYKLNGTPTKHVDERYGVGKPAKWQDRMKLIADGTAECARVTRLNLLVKCQDQVCSGHMRWQTDLVTEVAQLCGFVKVDRFDLIGKARKQPEGREQKHAYGRGSTLLVFARER